MEFVYVNICVMKSQLRKCHITVPFQLRFRIKYYDDRRNSGVSGIKRDTSASGLY